MASYRPAISNSLKKKLYAQAGQKCANPGCSNMRTHIHHIREWAVYQTHDEKHMIAICPSCHDLVHYGSLDISDDTLYRWKDIKRNGGQINDQIYIEPGRQSTLVIGGIAFRLKSGTVIFEQSEKCKLVVDIKDHDVMILDFSLSSFDGNEIIKIVNNLVKHQIHSEVNYQRRPGLIRVTVPRDSILISHLIFPQIEKFEPTFNANDVIIMFELEVVKPGVVRVQGVWFEGESSIVISKERFYYFENVSSEPVVIQVDGFDGKVIDFKNMAVIDVGDGVSLKERMFSFIP